MQNTNERPERADCVTDWEAMSQRYLPGRVSLLASMTSVLAERRPNVVVDLGCGPATVAGAIADRFPDAEVVGVDHDPVLLLLARRRARVEQRLRIIDARIDGDWPTTVRQRPDAVVTVLTLHYFAEAAWPSILRRIADSLTPGGVFVDVDVFAGGWDDRANSTSASVAPPPDDAPEWGEWWRRLSAGSDPEIAAALRARAQMEMTSEEFHPDQNAYRAMLLGAGFVDVIDRAGAACVVVVATR